jgi:hypothetical protein
MVLSISYLESVISNLEYQMPSIQYISTQETSMPRKLVSENVQTQPTQDTVSAVRADHTSNGGISTLIRGLLLNNSILEETDIIDEMVDAQVDMMDVDEDRCTEPDVKGILKTVKSKSMKPKHSKQFRFNETVLVGEVHSKEDYDRRSDFHLVLTPEIAMAIKTELNDFKSNEMMVHLQSRHMTHLFTI